MKFLKIDEKLWLCCFLCFVFLRGEDISIYINLLIIHVAERSVSVSSRHTIRRLVGVNRWGSTCSDRAEYCHWSRRSRRWSHELDKFSEDLNCSRCCPFRIETSPVCCLTDYDILGVWKIFNPLKADSKHFESWSQHQLDRQSQHPWEVILTNTCMVLTASDPSLMEQSYDDEEAGEWLQRCDRSIWCHVIVVYSV